MANPDPLTEVTGLTTALDVSKPETVAYLKSDLHWFSTCADVRSRTLAGRYRIMIGSRFFRKDTEDLSADDGTETSAVVIDGDGLHWLVLEGDRYDLPWSTSGQMGAGEALPAFVAVTPLTLPEGLPGSRCVAADEAPTSDFTVTWKKSLDNGVTWTTVFTATIEAGERTGTFTLAADATIAAGAMLRPYGPTPADATLEGFTATIAALR